MSNLNPTIRFTVCAEVASALDRFYLRTAARQRGARAIRRVPGQRSLASGSPQRMVTTEFVYGVIRQQTRPGETVDQTIFRLTGEILGAVK